MLGNDVRRLHVKPSERRKQAPVPDVFHRQRPAEELPSSVACGVCYARKPLTVDDLLGERADLQKGGHFKEYKLPRPSARPPEKPMSVA